MFKTTWKSYFKNNEKIPGNLLKNLEKSWKYHGILSVRKSGNPVLFVMTTVLSTGRFSLGSNLIPDMFTSTRKEGNIPELQ